MMELEYYSKHQKEVPGIVVLYLVIARLVFYLGWRAQLAGLAWLAQLALGLWPYFKRLPHMEEIFLMVIVKFFHFKGSFLCLGYNNTNTYFTR